MVKDTARQWKRLSSLLLACVLLVCSGCSTAKLEARVAYWNAETAAHLPIGASKQQAEEFFLERGVSLVCCISAPPGPRYHYIREPKIGQSIMMQHDVVVFVDLSTDDRVHSVLVQVLGIGF